MECSQSIRYRTMWSFLCQEDYDQYIIPYSMEPNRFRYINDATALNRAVNPHVYSFKFISLLQSLLIISFDSIFGFESQNMKAKCK